MKKQLYRRTKSGIRIPKEKIKCASIKNGRTRRSCGWKGTTKTGGLCFLRITENLCTRTASPTGSPSSAGGMGFRTSTLTHSGTPWHLCFIFMGWTAFPYQSGWVTHRSAPRQIFTLMLWRNPTRGMQRFWPMCS